MRRKIIIFRLFVVLILLFISFSSCSRGKSGKWKGKVEYEGKIKVVNNPSEPVYGELILELKEVLSIGNPDEENYSFYRPRNFELDEKGNFYILDRGNFRIQVYNKNGKYIKTIGKKGQGPGEFERPFGMKLDKKGNIYVNDFTERGLLVFNKEGNYQKTIPINYFFTDFKLSDDGSIFCIISQMIEKGRYLTFSKLNNEGKLDKEILKIPEFATTITSGTSTITTITFLHAFRFDLHFYFSELQNQFIYGDSSKYELSAISPSGELVFKFRKEEKEIPVTSEEKNKICDSFKPPLSKEVRDKIYFPPYRPYFSSFVIDSEGRIYVSRMKSPVDESKETEFDVFSPDGYYLYKTKLKLFPSIIKDGYIYARVEDEETGDIYFKKFQIKNYKSIRKEV
ncbi:MAG: NHL repeat-containing protein [Acidobacteriota bacterium]